MSVNMYIDGKENLFRQHTHFFVGESEPDAMFGGRRSDRFCKYKGGVPLAYDAERNIIAIDSGDTHTLVFGATGSRKTRCVIEPTIKILGCAGESMIISDPKSEIYNRLAGELKEKGYDIVVINIRDPKVGNAWNPLAIPFRFYMAGDIDRAAEFANDIAANFSAENSSTSEPFWDDSASDCLFGLIMLLMKYAKDHGKDENFVNISNLIGIRQKLFSGNAPFSMLWRYAKDDELISAALSGSVNAAKDTQKSILSVLDRKLRAFSIRPSLLDMLANNNIDIGSIDERKTAVFLIVPDEKTTYHNLVTCFVKQAYEYLIYKATESDDLKLLNRVNFILDEFCSLPPISSMSSMISAARSRDIRFLLAVQSYHSLKSRYKGEAETIKSNCINWIFLTSREIDLLREISALCGEQRTRTPNVSVYDLQHFDKEKGEALILSARLKPAMVNLLDVDSFGDSEYIVLDYEHFERKKREKADFELSNEIKDELSKEIEQSSPFLRNGIKSKENISKELDEVLKDLNIDKMQKELSLDALQKDIQRVSEKPEQEEAANKNSGKKGRGKA